MEGREGENRGHVMRHKRRGEGRGGTGSSGGEKDLQRRVSPSL